MNTLTTIRTINYWFGDLAPKLTARLARRILMTPHVPRPRDWELSTLAQAEPITFRFGLAGLRWGNEGPIVLLVHGWEGRPTQFAKLVAPLRAAGRQVIAIEAPAHGRSPGHESHVFAFTEALLEVGAELRGVEAVVGHSMGGSAALLALAQGLRAERAVVLGSPASLSRVLDRFATALALRPEARVDFLHMVDEHVGIPASSLDVETLGARLALPGLIVHDRDDESVPFAEAEALARGWKGAQLVATQGLGHRRVLGDPAIVARLADFLVGTPALLRAA
ncbi:MAG TPA: alpha/beta hydrolase [Xanthomonadales bacterium]|nr:alpha/beta hydrolase [Xanthomonadales bacterium]